MLIETKVQVLFPVLGYTLICSEFLPDSWWTWENASGTQDMATEAGLSSFERHKGAMLFDCPESRALRFFPRSEKWKLFFTAELNKFEVIYDVKYALSLS